MSEASTGSAGRARQSERLSDDQSGLSPLEHGSIEPNRSNQRTSARSRDEADTSNGDSQAGRSAQTSRGTTRKGSSTRQGGASGASARPQHLTQQEERPRSGRDSHNGPQTGRDRDYAGYGYDNRSSSSRGSSQDDYRPSRTGSGSSQRDMAGYGYSGGGGGSGGYSDTDRRGARNDWRGGNEPYGQGSRDWQIARRQGGQRDDSRRDARDGRFASDEQYEGRGGPYGSYRNDQYFDDNRGGPNAEWSDRRHNEQSRYNSHGDENTSDQFERDNGYRPENVGGDGERGYGEYRQDYRPNFDDYGNRSQHSRGYGQDNRGYDRYGQQDYPSHDSRGYQQGSNDHGYENSGYDTRGASQGRGYGYDADQYERSEGRSSGSRSASGSRSSGSSRSRSSTSSSKGATGRRGGSRASR